MNDTDELYTHVRESFDHVHLDEPVDQVTARGRSLRRRRVAVPFALTAMAAVALSATLGGTPPPESSNPVATDPGTHIHLAGWSVDTGPDDTVTLTVRVPPDPAQLTKALADAGVRAEVHVFEAGTYPDCVEDSLPELHEVAGSPQPTQPYTISQPIKPAAMPAGSILHLLFHKVARGHMITYSLRLLPEGVPVCKS